MRAEGGAGQCLLRLWNTAHGRPGRGAVPGKRSLALGSPGPEPSRLSASSLSSQVAQRSSGITPLLGAGPGPCIPAGHCLDSDTLFRKGEGGS